MNGATAIHPGSFYQKITGRLNGLPWIQWFSQKGYVQGVFWALMICLVSVSNDILMRLLGKGLPIPVVVFFRLFFSMLILMPWIIRQGVHSLYTSQPRMHFLRAVLGVFAIGLCCYGVNLMPLSENTAIMFSQPLFFLPLALILLKERVDMPRWSATIVGFIGLLILLCPGLDAFRPVAIVPILSAVLFALSDIMNKKMVDRESTLSLLFYFAVGTTSVAAIPLLFFWQTPTLQEFFLLLLLGCGANLIQVFLFKAFSATDASALMPFRYVEFIFSALFGFILFSEVPTSLTLCGAGLIIFSTFYISYYETRKEKLQKAKNKSLA